MFVKISIVQGSFKKKKLKKVLCLPDVCVSALMCMWACVCHDACIEVRWQSWLSSNFHFALDNLLFVNCCVHQANWSTCFQNLQPLPEISLWEHQSYRHELPYPVLLGFWVSKLRSPHSQGKHFAS